MKEERVPAQNPFEYLMPELLGLYGYRKFYSFGRQAFLIITSLVFYTAADIRFCICLQLYYLHKTYEIHMTATIQTGWHLYSQTQPEDAIAIPTGIKFTSNPLVTAEGPVKEVGK